MSSEPSAPGFPDDFLETFYLVLTEESLEAALASGARIIASVAGAECAAVFLAHGNDLTSEFWHPAGGSSRARFGAIFRQAAVEAARTEATPGGLPPVRSPAGSLCRAFLPAPRRAVTPIVCMTWPDATDADDEGRAERIDRLVRLLACKVNTDDDHLRFEAQRQQYERWFRTLDQQLRVLDLERQKFAAIVNQSDLWVYVTDLSRIIRWTNKAMVSAFPWAESRADWMGRSCQDLCTRLREGSGAPACVECPLTRALETNQPAHQELRRVTGGAARNLYVTALPIRGPDGKPNEVMVMLQDLTDLRVVRKSESRYRLLFERSANAIMMVEPGTYRIVLANTKATRMLGYTEAELLQRHLSDLHPEEEWRRLEALLVAADLDNRHEGLECRVHGRDNLERVAVVSATRFDLEGKEAVMLEYLDVTELKRAEKALGQKEEQLRQSQKLEAVGRLAGGMAHDFNNLLSVIMGRSELLRDRLLRDDPLRRDAEQIHGASVRGAWLTRQLLAFSRQEMASPEVIELRALADEMEPMVRSLVGETVELAIASGPGPARVRIDRTQVEQVILNLVLNARDAMPNGGLLRIEVTNVELDEASVPDQAVARPGPHVMLVVSDNGIGMDEETRSHIFEPFFTTKERGKGTGLGLSVVHGIVTQNGGIIRVTSAPRHGTSIAVYLPCERRQPEAAETPSVAHEVAGTETILLVEDDDAVREVAREALEMEGYVVLEARRGQDALDLADRSPPFQLVITDVVMPHMGGGELAQRLAVRYPEVKLLFMSGYADDAIVRHGVVETGRPFLQKPFTLEALTRKVREVLDGPPPKAFLTSRTPSRKLHHR